MIFGGTSDGSTLLVIAETVLDISPLWLMPMPAGDPRQLRISGAQSADLFPDGRIVFSRGNQVFVAEKNGSNTRRIMNPPTEVLDVEASPDGERVLIQMAPGAGGAFDLLAIAPDGTGLRRLRKGAQGECCFRWDSDGNHVLYISKSGMQGRYLDICHTRRRVPAIQ